MFKSLTNFIHRLPWWGLVSGGLLTLVALVLLAVPYNVIWLQSRGGNSAEQRAIQREIDATMAHNGLGLAEGVVRTMQAYAGDPVRQAELQRALDEIARARREIDAEKRDVRIVIRSDSEQAVHEAEVAVREAELDAAMAAYEASVDARQALEDSLEELRRALKEGGIPESEWPKTLDARTSGQREAEAEAKRRVDEAREKLNRALDAAANPPTPPIPPAHPDKPSIPELPRPPGLNEKPPTIERKPPALAEGMPGVTVDLRGNELPAELKAEIAVAVGNDFYRGAIGAILILLFIPLFMVLLIAKFFVDRARRAQTLAEEKTTEAEQASLQRQITEARLQALQAQVEPHFLYNTLANVQALIEVDPPAAGTMVGHLIDYLRAALPKMRESQSTVAQELELARAYLAILKMRMGERLEFMIDAEPAAAALPFPPLMLPSLVENAIKHGIEPVREGGRIAISARVEQQRLVLSVVDSGRGLSASLSAPAPGTGVGLANIRERLQALHGDGARLSLDDAPGGGAEARIELPLEQTGGVLRPRQAEARTAFVEPTPVTPVAPRNVAERIGRWLSQAHKVWRRVIGMTFIGVMLALLAGLLVAIVALLAGVFPVQLGTVQLHGAGGGVLGILGLLAAFGVAAVVLAVLVGVLYLLGFVMVGVLIAVPFFTLLGSAPLLGPLLIFGLLIYWALKKRDERKPR
jgi:hypothetical protein